MGNVPFRNNFKLLRGFSPATDFLDYVDENLGIGFNPAVILAGTTEDVSRIEAIAREQQTNGRPDGRASRIGKVFSITDLIPQNPDALRPDIERLRQILVDPKLDRAEKKEGKRAEQLAQARKMVKTEPWTEAELPQTFTRRLTSENGKEYIVFLWPDEQNVADYQATAWEDELHLLSEKITAAGISHSMADETLIVAWIYRLIQKDGLPLLIVAAAVVLFFLAVDLRSFRHLLLVAFPLAIGMGTMLFVAVLSGLELNMFNLIVIPSVIGIGIDNAVHIFHRYKTEGEGSVLLVLRTTGTAALLASVTTGIGFGSSLISHHLGLKSLGTLAVIGISATFVASTVFFPCLLSLLERRKGADRADDPR